MQQVCPLDLGRDKLIEYTSEWSGDRFADGRPRVPDSLIEDLQDVTVTQAWAALTNAGFPWQYEGDFMCTHPGQVLIGRALTAVYMPRRPDMRKLMEEKGVQSGYIGDQISWPIDQLSDGDVYVADVFGKIEQGPVIGDNLSTAIYRKSGRGVVHDAAVRDIDGIRALVGFTSFVRGAHPSYASPTIMLAGINTVVRIGHVTVMPGDIVLGRDDGVVFIPPHLVEKVVRTAQVVRLRDVFGKLRLREEKYTPGQIDDRWTSEIEEDFWRWFEAQGDALPFSMDVVQTLLKERTW